MIKDITCGNLFKIEQLHPYSEDYKTCIKEAKLDLQKNSRPKLLSLPSELDDYDEIYLGYPNYWGTMPMVVYTFLEKFNFKGKTIHPFCTNEGSGLSNTVEDIKKIAKGALVTKGLSIHGSSVDKAVLKAWIEDN